MSDARLRALVGEIRDGTCTVETDAVEWKRTLDFTTAEGRFPLPKNILGMANRMPEVARREFGGFGYILVGVENGALPGVPSWDPAQLHDWINPYIGATGPNWQPRYVTVDNQSVLAIEVDPPRPGDDPHTLRKECDKFHRGTILVRKNGKTHRADDQDVANLVQCARGTRLDLDLQLIGANKMSWFDRVSISNEIAQIADGSRDSQLAQARSYRAAGEPGSVYGRVDRASMVMMYGEERRSIDTYKSQVDKWHANWVGTAQRHWLDRYLLTGHGAYSLRLDNRSDQNFADVEVRLRIEGVSVEDEIPSEAIELPTKPKPYGKGTRLVDAAKLSFEHPLLRLDPPTEYEPPEITVAQRDGAVEVVWDVGHLRPAAGIESYELGSSSFVGLRSG
ncbi:MAG: hypothetical protein F4Z53_14975 [Acidimicrobiales bacterium]|nr:hypothetical protein [Acidimicrobiales bacterium]MYD32548.1 hypothetical protein [Acidimicrobiales bacterium]MYI09141.1 hypothetical protein [Acidimicrobiales bacterium]